MFSVFCCFNNFFHFEINPSLGFGSLQTSILRIIGEFIGGGSVAVAVGVSDM